MYKGGWFSYNNKCSGWKIEGYYYNMREHAMSYTTRLPMIENGWNGVCGICEVLLNRCEGTKESTKT
jgi:hypothetical protein